MGRQAEIGGLWIAAGRRVHNLGMRRLARTLAAFLVLGGISCTDDGGDDGATSFDSTATLNPTSSTTAPGTDTGSAESSSSGAETTMQPTTATTDPMTSSESSAGSSSGGNACDPVVPGGWNSCHDESGNVDNTQCMWMGSGDSQGFIGCLTSSSLEGANVCMISDCVDTCDCFAPPSTGNAEVICADILAGGGFACALSCADGQTCPDGMVCESGLCFWPPA